VVTDFADTNVKARSVDPIVNRPAPHQHIADRQMNGRAIKVHIDLSWHHQAAGTI